MQAASPDHLEPSLSGPTVKRVRDARYRVRGTLNGHGSPRALECQLDDAQGAMEVLGLSVVHR